ncbi:hypothetical protein [uncultured Helicobacter sp.]|uniref:hypothetical protein n=1 Tax=uncultured Helicobacter sp. TaxID=175537 RepID=UPI003750F3C1
MRFCIRLQNLICFIENAPLPNRVPDALTPNNYRISHLDSVYARAAERAEIHSPRAASSLP